jgi:DNA polymerase-3 subunit chi
MIKVSFYLIEQKPMRPADLACRLCQQIYRQHRVWVYCADSNLAQHLDQRLWQGDAVEFIPHGIDQVLAPICLSTMPPEASFDVCINLTAAPLNVTEFAHAQLHIIEIIGNNETDKQQARQHFKYYRDLNCTPIVHKL